MAGERRVNALQRHLDARACSATDDAIAGAFDYIVVGGGTAGSVIASRLSEDSSSSVLVIEAGGSHQRFLVNAPLAQQDLQLSNLDWHFETTPEKQLKNRSIFWPRGKVLGGCSSINAMAYVRGDPLNFARWPSGWKYEDVLPYFRRSEALRRDAEHQNVVDEKYRSRNGPMTVTHQELTSPSPWSRRFVEAAVATGFELRDDYNGASQAGVSLAQSMVKDGKRESTAHAFLPGSVLARPNLKVMTFTHVCRLVFQGSKVTGVLVRSLPSKLQSLPSDKQLHYLRSVPDRFIAVCGEVVVCAGAVNSPWLLQQSGIGPKRHLSAMGIPSIADLCVGENLQDHLASTLLYEVNDGDTLDALRRPSIRRLFAIGRYLLTGTGAITSTLLEATLFYRSGLQPNRNENDVQIIFVPAIMDRYVLEALTNNFLILRNCWHRLPQYGVSFVACHLLPASSGHVRVASADCLAAPIITPNYLQNPVDMKSHVHMLKTIRKIAQSPTWTGLIGKEVLDPNIIEELGVDPASDDYLRELVRRISTTLYHPIGTCKMAEHDDPTGVVDTRLRVRGLQGVRVADASVIPTLTSGNTCAPVIMVAERAAQIIRDDNRSYV